MDNVIKIKKIPRCRHCGRYKTGDVCVCGHTWQKENQKGKITRINQKNIPTCKYCNEIGSERDGLCERHAEVENLKGGIKHWLGFRNSENKINVCRQIDNFVNAILNTLKPDEECRTGWINFKQKNLKRMQEIKQE